MKPTLPSDVDREITALIATLHETGQRLELLTDGEVDSVSDAQGRTFLLQGPQDRLRLAEAARQAAVLNALPAHVALLDAQGIVASVNEAWQQFCAANGGQGLRCGVGADYLAICDRARGRDADEAHLAAEGIRSVLAGTAQNFSLEYPCHAPSEKRWFLMIVSPLTTESRPNGAVVMHVAITAKVQAQEDLLQSEERFRQMAENIRDVFFLRDSGLDGPMLYVSPAYRDIWGRSCESLYADPASWGDAILPEDRAATQKKMRSSLPEGRFELEYRIVRPDGSIRWIESRGFPVRDAAGTIVRIAGVAADITARKLAEVGIRRLNRVYAVLSQINELIVRERNRDELFREVCRIAVEVGGYRMAWIGLTDRTSMKLVPTASAGADEILVELGARFMLQDDAPAGYGPSGLAARECRTILVNDVENDPRIQSKKAYADRGICSFVVLPLMVGDDAAGVLGLYAPETGFFDEPEMKLLRELAGDIAYAIDHIAKQDRLDYLAYYDALTGLANRNLFMERVVSYVRSAAATGHSLALLLIDLDRFRAFNDILGSPAGDALLQHVAKWLTHSTGDVGLLARVGADEFAVVLPEVRHERDVTQLLETSMAALVDHPFHLEDEAFRLTAKAGVALFPQDGREADTLFRNAESALNKAKASGDRYLFYTQKMTEAAAGRLTLENQLRQAIAGEEFVLHYQPKVSVASGKLVSVEALIRWTNPAAGLTLPRRIIPVLEETGLIHEVGRWVLRKAMEDYLRWRNAGLPAVRVAVNVSALQLRSRGFIAEIEQVIAVDEHAAAGLEIEITESVIMEDREHGIATLQAIRDLGVTVAVDDFGTGFSSLGYLARLPVDALKIDRSFVSEMTLSSRGLALVSTIITLAHALELKPEGHKGKRPRCFHRGRCDCIVLPDQNFR